MSSSDRQRRHARRLSRSGRNTIMLPIDFYFDFASPYGFLAAMQIDALAERAGRTVRWRPFLLGAVYKQVEQSPLDHPPKRDYVNNIDAPRCARLLGLTLQRPRGWPEHALPPTRIFYWLDRDDPARAADYARAAYRKYWLSGESTADPDAAADVAAALGHNRADALAAMHDIAVKQRVIDANDAAVARGVFGSPFFFVDDEPFWGSDRLSQIAAFLERGSI